MELLSNDEKIPKEINVVVYSAEITNGYVFRQIFELYDKLVIEGIPVYFKESGITIRTGTSSSRDSMKLISDIEIYTDDIISYYLNEDLATIKRDEETTPCYIEELNINTVKSVFKSIAKSNSVRIYKTTLSDDVFIEIKGLTTEHSRLSTSKYRKIHYDISDYQDDMEKPNLKIEISQFCTTMKGMTRGDAEYTSFKVFPEGLMIEGRNGTGSITKDMRWGNLPNLPSGEIDKSSYFETKVSSSSIKALTKISSMSNYSIIKILSFRDGLMRLNHKIGDFGEHNVYLVDNS
jgi:hypothetical protein